MSTALISSISGQMSLRQASPEGPWLAPATVAVRWDGTRWQWAQWTGVNWVSLPWSAVATGQMSDSVASSVAEPEPLAILSMPQSGGEATHAAAAVRSGRRAPYEPSLLVMLTGHVVAALLGLLLGYYILCCLRPAEFNHWNLPLPALVAPSDASAGASVSLADSDFSETGSLRAVRLYGEECAG